MTKVKCHHTKNTHNSLAMAPVIYDIDFGLYELSNVDKPKPI
jgi:hypothetical protein